MNVDIIRADQRSWSSLVNLMRDFDRYNHSFQEHTTALATGVEIEMATEELLGRSFGEVWIAYENERPVGYISIIILDQLKQCVIEDLFVFEAFRGKGLGKQLFRIAEKCANQKKYEMKLEVFTWNESTIEFYKKLGFRIDGYVMVKESS